ncbi:GNAT family N-acetyltransferase [Methylobacter sp.]|uniref:GNAT family N-acetyltransferase n=1 Tax=Methylobacter sp. TaxID=2051955 RepID=UPI0025EE52A2|nr:GNAT family N-acetyltransferase [Methylobacter sp.]
MNKLIDSRASPEDCPSITIGSTMQITPANASDIPALCELLDILFSQEADFKPDYEAQSRGLARIISSPEVGLVVVARQDGQVVGMANLLYTVSTALGDRVALLEDVVVSPSVRGSGVGSRLMEHAIQFARLNGCKRITVLTDRENESAQRFYQKHGFGFSAMMPMRLSLSE